MRRLSNLLLEAVSVSVTCFIIFWLMQVPADISLWRVFAVGVILAIFKDL